MALNVDSLPAEPEKFQGYLDELPIEQLPKLESALTQGFQALRENDNPTEEMIDRLSTYGDQITATRDALKSREATRIRTAAMEAEKARNAALKDLDKVVFGDSTAKSEKTEPTESKAVEAMADVFASAIAKAVATSTVTAASTPNRNLNSGIRNMSLGAVRQNAPDPGLSPARSEAVIIASSDIPGHTRNQNISGIRELTKLMGARARMLSTTKGNPNYVAVASMQRDFRYRLSLDSTPEEINDVLTAATDVNALVAAGGWCAPSEISYDFFNIVCEDGLIDLPSVGVLNRGGFRFPVSPTIADVLTDSSLALWSWTEAQDEDAAISDSDVKTCARVPCVTFDEVRAACDGLCVTAGNLTDFAYPELVENFIRLVMAARAHVTNQSVIAQLVAASTPVTTPSVEGATASILNSIELQAFDYRERYRMCEGSILEVVLPRWAYGVIRADLANRTGLAMFAVTDSMIADWFDIRGIRVQLVADWQSGFVGSPIGAPVVNATAWPTTVQYLIYAPGTFVRGQGLQLDLGVVRDSILNETNDHTAAWMEDCYAIAMVGHESRLVTTDICTAGSTGAAELSCA